MVGCGGRLNRSRWTLLGFNIIILELSELRSLLLLQRTLNLWGTDTQIDRQIYYKHRHYIRQMYTDTDRYTDRSITNTDITEDRCTQTLIDIQIDLLQTQTLQKIDVYDRQTDRYITNTDITEDICTLTDRQIDLLQTTQTFQKIGLHRQIDKQIYYKHRHYRRQMYADRQTDRSIRNKDMTVDIYTLSDRQIDILQHGHYCRYAFFTNRQIYLL